MASNTARKETLHAYTRQLCDRIVPLAAFLDDQWLDFCSRKETLRVSSIIPRPAESLADHGTYGQLPRVRYYDIAWNLHRAWGEGPPFAAGEDPGDELRKAVLTWNRCDDVVLAVWEYLKRELRTIPGFLKMESKRADVVPRIILFDHEDPPGDERSFKHNYITITFERGIRFFLDLTGYQFGYQRVLYIWEEFKHQVLGGKDDGEEVDVEDEIRRHTNLAMGLDDSGGVVDVPHRMRARASELLGFTFEL